MLYTVENHSYSRITPATLEKMHLLVRLAKTDPVFINLILYITRNCKARDHLCEIKTLYDVFYDKIKYVRDPFQVEKVQSVWAILDKTEKPRAADCDCSSVLLAASGGAIGYQYRFVTIKSDPVRPEDWSHVWAQLKVPSLGWVSMDITLPFPDMGFTATGWETKYWDEPAY